MIRRLALLALVLWGGVARAQGGVTVRLDDGGPGIGPEILARALAQPHTVIPPSSERFLVTRASQNRQTLLVLGRDAVVEGRVEGDVIVVAGDLYMHPGASITGRAIAFGGGVYESMLATIGGGATSYRDFTYDIVPIAGGYSLRYRPLTVAEDVNAFTLPGIFGFSLPTYDRTNGLSLGVGPRYQFPGTGVAVAPRVVYRSQLGRFDPSVDITDQLDRRTMVRARLARTTASNDRWIRGDLINSAIYLWNGDDTRNYYRTTGGDLTVTRTWESVSGRLAPYVGARYERASSVRPTAAATGGPWTFLARKDVERDDRLRTNPAIDDGKRIATAIAGAAWTWSDEGTRARLSADGEFGSGFGQVTIDGRAEFPTFKTQKLRVDCHTVASFGGRTPRQRYAYVGGSGTMPTIDLLAEGGDQLFFVDAQYDIPIASVVLPFLGSPLLTLREVLGGARIGRFPTLHQASGFRLAAGPLYAEFLIDPVTRHTHNGVGVTVTP